MLILVTGATGFVGGHVAETLVAKGHRVRTIARPSSDVGLLKQWGVEICEGDLCDPVAIARACQGVEAVVHCAAKVGEWGPIEEYRKVNVRALEVLLQASMSPQLRRFILVSSLGVYEAKDHFGTDETAALPDAHFDGYTTTKIEAERLAMEYHRERNVPLVILRPGFIYGPRDRTIMPRILTNLKFRLVTYFGNREKLLNNVYVGNVVEAVVLALDNPKAVGQTYNITDGKCVSKREFFETICQLTKLPRPLFTYPMWFAKSLCRSFEVAGRIFGITPILNMARLKFMGLNLDYSIEKAKRELGYRANVSFEQGIKTTIDWLRQQGCVK
ncbi:MAG: NAD-dependent epimerase/dehydratase family protein [Planctomycetota bacterium]